MLQNIKGGGGEGIFHNSEAQKLSLYKALVNDLSSVKPLSPTYKTFIEFEKCRFKACLALPLMA